MDNVKKIEALEKYNEELIANVKFSDISRFIISTDTFTKYECFELLHHSNSTQMKLFLDKMRNQIETRNGNEIWPIFLQGLRQEYPILAAKIDSEFSTSSLLSSLNPLNENVNNDSATVKNDDLKSIEIRQKLGRKLDKSDIGMPKDFKHLMHIGYSSEDKMEQFGTFNNSEVIQQLNSNPNANQLLFNFMIMMDYLKKDEIKESELI